VTSKKLQEELLRVIPELGSAYRAEREWWRDELPPTHVIFGDLFAPYLLKLLDDQKDAGLVRAFGLLERMVLEGDEQVREMVITEVFERLAGDKRRSARARPYLGPGLLEVVRGVENPL